MYTNTNGINYDGREENPNLENRPLSILVLLQDKQLVPRPDYSTDHHRANGEFQRRPNTYVFAGCEAVKAHRRKAHRYEYGALRSALGTQ